MSIQISNIIIITWKPIKIDYARRRTVSIPPLGNDRAFIDASILTKIDIPWVITREQRMNMKALRKNNSLAMARRGRQGIGRPVRRTTA